mgnify:CR=1 FL=1
MSKNLNRKKLRCTRCPKEYQSRNDLIRHLGKIHGLNESEAENETLANYFLWFEEAA